MGLKVEAHWGAEDVIVGLHEALLVAVGLQVFGRTLDGLQASMLRRLHVELGREVGAESPVQAGVVAQVTAL